MKHNLRMTTSLVLLSAFTTIVMAPVASIASTVGRRNTAIGLTAATIWAASKGKSKTALVAGVGAAYAWKRHADSKRHPTYYRNYRRGGHTYYSNYRRGHNNGVRRGQYARRVHFVKNGKVHYYSARR